MISVFMDFFGTPWGHLAAPMQGAEMFLARSRGGVRLRLSYPGLVCSPPLGANSASLTSNHFG